MSNNVAAAASELYEVRCCCHPENLIGFLPKQYERTFRKRELSDGTWALDNQHQEEKIRKLDDFVPNYLSEQDAKTWKKTWKKVT